MAIYQLKKQSDLEKRLKFLRHQIYGKQPSAFSYQPSDKDSKQFPMTDSYSVTSDIAYLRHDLLKIATLACAAFAIQVILYYLLQNNILRLNLF